MITPIASDLHQASRNLAAAFRAAETASAGCYVSAGHRDRALVAFVLHALADSANEHGPLLAVVWEHRHRAEVAG